MNNMKSANTNLHHMMSGYCNLFEEGKQAHCSDIHYWIKAYFIYGSLHPNAEKKQGWIGVGE